jgi:hypothetical protein
MRSRTVLSCHLLAVTVVWLQSSGLANAELLDVEEGTDAEAEEASEGGVEDATDASSQEEFPSFRDVQKELGKDEHLAEGAVRGAIDRLHLSSHNFMRYSSTTLAPIARGGYRVKSNVLDYRRRTSSYIALAFSIIITIVWLRYLIVNESSKAAIIKRANELKELEKTYCLLMTDIETKVRHLCDLQVDWSQHIFNTKKNDFVDFMHRIRSNPERYSSSSSQLIGPFKSLVKLWLNNFREASIDPDLKPFVPVSDAEIDSCGSIAEITDVISHLQYVPVQFIELPQSEGNRKGSCWQVDAYLEGSRAERIEFLDKLECHPHFQGYWCAWISWRDNNPSYLSATIRKHQVNASGLFPREHKICGLIRINILSFWHFLQILLWIIIQVCWASNWYFKAHVSLLYTTVAVILSYITLWRFEFIDLAAALRLLALQIHVQKDMMTKKGREIAAMELQVEQPSQVWLYCTRPKLEILAGYTRKIANSKWPKAEQLKEFIEIVVQAHKMTQRCMGKPKDFGQLSLEAMQIVKQQVETYSEFIAKGSARDVKMEAVSRAAIPKMICVRVIGCSELPKGNIADDYDPYVRMRTKKDSRWLQTMARQDETDPKWHTTASPCEFRFLLNGTETQLDVEVMDENSLASDTFIGETSVPIRELDENGSWQKITKPLQDSSTGVVTLEMFLVTRLSKLHKVCGGGPRMLHHIPDDSDPDGRKAMLEDSCCY